MKKAISLALVLALICSVLTVLPIATQAVESSASGTTTATVAHILPTSTATENNYYLGTKSGTGVTEGIFSGLTFAEGEDFKSVYLLVYNTLSVNVEVDLSAYFGMNVFTAKADGDGVYTYTLMSSADRHQVATANSATILTFKLPKQAVIVNSYTTLNKSNALTSAEITQIGNGSGSDCGSPYIKDYKAFGLRFNISSSATYANTDGLYVMALNDEQNTIIEKMSGTTTGGVGSATFSAVSEDETPEKLMDAYKKNTSGVEFKADGSTAYINSKLANNVLKYMDFAGKTTKTLQFAIRNNTDQTLKETSLGYGFGQWQYAADTEYDSSNKPVANSTKYASVSVTKIAPGETKTLSITTAYIADVINNGDSTDANSKLDISYKDMSFRFTFSGTAKGTVDIYCVNDDSVNYGLSEIKGFMNRTSFTGDGCAATNTAVEITPGTSDAYFSTQSGSGVYTGVFRHLRFASDETSKTVTFLVYNSTSGPIAVNLGAKWGISFYTASGSADAGYTYTEVTKSIGTYQGNSKLIEPGEVAQVKINVPKQVIVSNGVANSTNIGNGSGTDVDAPYTKDYTCLGLRINKYDAAGTTSAKYTAGDKIYIMAPNNNQGEIIEDIANTTTSIGSASFSQVKNNTLPASLADSYAEYTKGATFNATAAHIVSSGANNVFSEMDFGGATNTTLKFLIKNNTDTVLNTVAIGYGYCQHQITAGSSYDSTSGAPTGTYTNYNSLTTVNIAPGGYKVVELGIGYVADVLNQLKKDTNAQLNCSYKKMSFRFSFTTVPGSDSTVDIRCLNDDAVNGNLSALKGYAASKDVTEQAGGTVFAIYKATSYAITKGNIFNDVDFGDDSYVTLQFGVRFNGASTSKLSEVNVAYNWGSTFYDKEVDIDTANTKYYNAAYNVLAAANGLDTLEEVSFTFPSKLASTGATVNLTDGGETVISVNVPKVGYVVNSPTAYLVYSDGTIKSQSSKPSTGTEKVDWISYTYYTQNSVEAENLAFRMNGTFAANDAVTLTCVNDDSVNENMPNTTSYQNIVCISVADKEAIVAEASKQYSSAIYDHMFYTSLDTSAEVDKYIDKIGYATKEFSTTTTFGGSAGSVKKSGSNDNHHYDTLILKTNQGYCKTVINGPGKYVVQYMLYIETAPGECSIDTCNSAVHQLLSINYRYITTSNKDTNYPGSWTTNLKSATDDFTGKWIKVKTTIELYESSFAYNDNIRIGLADNIGASSRYYIDDICIAKEEDFDAAMADVESSLVAANIDVTSDLTANYYAVIGKYDTDNAMCFTRNEITTYVEGTLVEDSALIAQVNASLVANGKPAISDDQALYKYAYEGITTQSMTDNISAVLYGGIHNNAGEIATDNDYSIGAINNYSVRANVNNLIASNPDNTALKTLLADLLDFGAAAQQITTYNTTDLANADAWVTENASEFEVPTDIISTKVTKSTTDTSNRVTAVAGSLSNVIKLRFKVTLKGTGYTLKLTRNGEDVGTFTAADLEGGNLYTEAIAPNMFGDEFVLQVIDAESNVTNEVHYSVNTFIAAKYDSEQLTEVQRTLIKNMAKFGASVSAYYSA